MKEMVFDADNSVAGRLASVAARHLLRGEAVAIVNAEKAMVTGRPEAVAALFREKVERGDPYHGPFYPKQPERMLKRMVRGMINYHKPRGREAFKRLRVYAGVPPALAGKAVQSSEAQSRAQKFLSLKDISGGVHG